MVSYFGHVFCIGFVLASDPIPFTEFKVSLINLSTASASIAGVSASTSIAIAVTAAASNAAAFNASSIGSSSVLAIVTASYSGAGILKQCLISTNSMFYCCCCF